MLQQITLSLSSMLNTHTHTTSAPSPLPLTAENGDVWWSWNSSRYSILFCFDPSPSLVKNRYSILYCFDPFPSLVKKINSKKNVLFKTVASEETYLCSYEVWEIPFISTTPVHNYSFSVVLYTFGDSCTSDLGLVIPTPSQWPSNKQKKMLSFKLLRTSQGLLWTEFYVTKTMFQYGETGSDLKYFLPRNNYTHLSYHISTLKSTTFFMEYPAFIRDYTH